MADRKTLNVIGLDGGVTLLEFLAYIGLVALLLAGVLGFYSMSRQSAVGVDALQTANSIVSALRAVNAQQTTPDWVGSARALKPPAGWGVWSAGGANLTSMKKSGVTISIRQVAGNPNATIEFSTTEEAICLKLAQGTVGGQPATPNGCASSPYTVRYEQIASR